MDDEVLAHGDAPPPSDIPVAVGQIIADRYRIGSVIGSGGMGVVCAGTHVGLGTPVALKLIRSDLKHDRESVLRFLNEARAAASLKGEHIARVFDVGQLATGEPYLVMEQLEGVGLDVYLHERGPLSQAAAVEIVLQACEGLAEAHGVALVHRDIKPGNLFLALRPDGQFTLKILDFGIAKRLATRATRSLTDPGKSLGSPWYMAPEQMLAASTVDQRADIWSLGVLLFELLTKALPFAGDSVPQICASVLTAPAPLVSSERPDLERGLDEVVLRCLEKDPNERYQSVAELAEALRPFAADSAASRALGLDETPKPADTKRRRHRSFGSLVPLLSTPRAAAPSRIGSALVVLAAGALLAALGAPLVEQHLAGRGLADLRQLSWSDVARIKLPFDPQLGAAPPTTDYRPRTVVHPTLLQVTRGTAVVERAVEPPARVEEPSVLSPTEARLRAERYEQWLRDQGLKRLDDAGAEGE